jgi:hypothetical protein
MSALVYASLGGHVSCVEALISHKADVQQIFRLLFLSIFPLIMKWRVAFLHLIAFHSTGILITVPPGLFSRLLQKKVTQKLLEC